MKILAFMLMLAALAPSMEDIFNECLEQSDVAKILACDQDALQDLKDCVYAGYLEKRGYKRRN